MKIKMKIGIGVIATLAFLCVLGSTSAAEEIEFKVLSTDPADGSNNVPITASVSITFSAPVNESTLVAANFIVMNTHDGDYFDGLISYDNTTYTVTISDFSFRDDGHLEGGGGLHRGANIVVKLLNIEDVDGNKLLGSDEISGSNYEFHFNVVPRATDEEDSPGFGLLAAILIVVSVMALIGLARKAHSK